MNIPLSEVKFSSLSLMDTARVFSWSGRVFRAVPDTYAENYRALFDSGLIHALVDNNLFVDSWLTDYVLEGYALVIEHEVVSVPVYPREWTISMLKDAALLVLAVNKIARKFGYQTQDCHGYNVLFRHGHPVYVDLGSFTKVAKDNQGLLAYQQFMQCYLFPLKIWRSGGSVWGMRVFQRANFSLPAESYFRYRWPIFRCVSDRVLAKLTKAFYSAVASSHREQNKAFGRYPRCLINFFQWLAAHSYIGNMGNMDRLVRKVSHMRFQNEKTIWSGYHDSVNSTFGSKSSPRFEYIIKLLTKLEVASVLEIAGNQGLLACKLATQPNIRQVICTDADVAALDKGYQLAKADNVAINWAVLNPFSYESHQNEIPVVQRYASDAVLALALTHHLTLSQGMNLGFVFDVVKTFTRKFVLIEFMPLGLYAGEESAPPPAWYNERWFEDEFVKKFRLVEKTELEANRILFVGEIISENIE